MRFLLIAGVTAAAALGAAYYFLSKEDEKLNSAQVESEIQRAYTKQLRAVDASLEVRSISCIQRADGPNLKCIAKVTDGTDTESVGVDVTAGIEGRYSWEATR